VRMRVEAMAIAKAKEERRHGVDGISRYWRLSEEDIGTNLHECPSDAVRDHESERRPDCTWDEGTCAASLGPDHVSPTWTVRRRKI
jgi:hypothetical protein